MKGKNTLLRLCDLLIAHPDNEIIYNVILDLTQQPTKS